MKSGEEELARRVIGWLQSQDFEIYQEVQLYRSGPIADIVGRRGALLVVIETKMHFCAGLIEQAFRWLHDAHYVMVAVPYTGKRGGSMLKRLCRHEGIGILIVNEYGVEEVLRPHLHRRIGSHLQDGLCEAQKTWARAGNASSEYWTPFRQTSQAITKHVAAHPGCTLKELIDGIEHHYASPAMARGAIRQWIARGVIAGVRMELERGRAKLYPQVLPDDAGGMNCLTRSAR